MRFFKMLALLLPLVTAAKAGLDLTVGPFTYSFSENPTSIALTAGGSVNVLLPGPTASISISSPYGFAVGDSFIVSQIEDVPMTTLTGVYGGLYGYDQKGNRIYGSLDLGNYSYDFGPCTACGLRSLYDSPAFFPVSDIPLDAITKVLIEESTIGYAADDEVLAFVGNVYLTPYAVTPEPSALLLTVTVVAFFTYRARRRILQA